MNESSSDHRKLFSSHIVVFPASDSCWHIHRPILLEFRPLKESKLNIKKQQYIYLIRIR